jgi:hypothetical protein
MRLRRFIFPIIFIFCIWVFAFGGIAMLARPSINDRIQKVFADMGYPHASYTLLVHSMNDIEIKNVTLDPEGISTIDDIHITASPFYVLNNKITDVQIKRPDFIFGPDDPPLPRLARFYTSLQNTAQTLRTLKIDDLNISYAGDTFNPTVKISTDIQRDPKTNAPQALWTIYAQQKDLNLNIKGSYLPSPTNPLQSLFSMDIIEGRIDTDHIMTSRTSGNIRAVVQDGLFKNIDGKILIGGARIYTLPLGNIRIGLRPKNTSAPLPVEVFIESDVPQVPETSFSGRLVYNTDSIKGLFQLSGMHPEEMIRTLMPDTGFPVPNDHKFTLSYKVEEKNILSFLSSILKGTLFIYGDTQNPIAGMTIDCTQDRKGCMTNLPPTTFSANVIQTWMGDFLDPTGIHLNTGNMMIQGETLITDSDIIPLSLSYTSDDMDLTWKGIDLSNVIFDITHTSSSFLINRFSANGLSGHITLQSNAHGGKTSYILDGKDLDFGSCASVFGLRSSLNARGKVDVSLNWIPDPSAQSLSNVSINIKGNNGQFSYRPKTYPPYLSGSSKSRQAIRGILNDMDYEHIDISLNAVTAKKANGKISLSGTSPLYGAQPIQLELKGDGSIPDDIINILTMSK